MPLPTVYPRVGGGNSRQSKTLGNVVRSIPAWAGETGQDLEPTLNVKVYPRVGGGNDNTEES